MKLVATLISVKDMEYSKKFYNDVLGLSVTSDFGANVTLDGGIALQTEDTWKDFIHTDSIKIGNGSELYFEAENMDSFVEKLERMPDIKYVHKLFEHRWGQRVVRIYDPDGHILEIGENMTEVIKRFMAGGMTEEQTAKRMDVSLEFVKNSIK